MDEEKYRVAVRKSFSRLDQTVERWLARKIKELQRLEVLDPPFVLFEFCDTAPYGAAELHIQDGCPWRLDVPDAGDEISDEDDSKMFEIEHEEVMRWFADRWNAIDGPLFFQHALAEFHWGSDFYAFDLAKRIWISEWPAV